MKLQRTLPALLLTVAMMLSMVTPAWAAGTEKADDSTAATGSIQATVRLDYAQTLEEIKEREVKAELFMDKKSLGTADLTIEKENISLGQYKAKVAHRSAQNGELPDDASSQMTLDLTVTGLPKGDGYALRFTGKGYVTHEVSFKITSYNKYIEVGTGDSTFTLGDINGDKKVDEKDRDALSEALNSDKKQDIDTYDLNGDGKIDIIDLAYVNHNIKTFSNKVDAVCLDTVCFEADLDEAGTRFELEKEGTTADGSIFDILRNDGNSPVTFKSDGEKIVIPVSLKNSVDTENIQIMTPSTGGTIQKGTVHIEQADTAEILTYTFDETVPEGVHAITRSPGNNIITINLGKRVAVKKITITVTKKADGDYATVESIQFLKDIVPENLVEPNSKIKSLSAEPGDGLVDLTWPELPNVSSYRVDYWEEGKESDSRQLNVDINKAQVTGLKNLKYYQFTVTPTDGTWEGKACDPVTAMPQPTKVPPPPDMVNVTALDGKLAVSWKKGKEATYFEVYYTDKADADISAYKQYGGKLTDPSVTMDGLTNDTTYYIYIVAGNDVGKSGPSRISSGTPKEVKYEMPEGIPVKALLNNKDLIKSVSLADPNNVNKGEYTTSPFDPQNIIDGNYKTHWTAKNWASNEHVNVEFKNPVDLYGVIWVPRLDGSYPNYLRAYSVRVWYQGEDLNGKGHLLTKGTDDGSSKDTDVWTWPEIPNRGQIPTTKFAIMPFDTAKNVVKISVAAEQAGYNIVSCSELLFLEYDESRCLPDQIKKLFADDLYTTLASGVTEAKIAELKALLERDRNYYLNPNTLADELTLAEELLEGQSNGVVLNGLQAPAGVESHGQGGSDLQPLGVTAKAGQEITIYASGIPDNKTVPIYASQFNAEASTWKAPIGEIKNGRNILVVPKIGSQNTERGGSLYYTYNIPKGATAEEVTAVKSEAAGIKIHIRRAVDIPVLQLADWYDLDEKARQDKIDVYLKELEPYVKTLNLTTANAGTKTTNVTEISTPSVLLSIPAATVNGKTAENLYNSILAWEDIMHICKTTQGIDASYEKNKMPTRQNVRCMQMFAGAFMYAAGNHIGIGYGSCGGMVSGTPISKLASDAKANNLFGWGIAHEIGHNMDKLGKAEITNNIYSIMVQTYDGKNNTFASRLENSNKYPAIFTKVAQGYPGASNDVFVQLGMYWQLHLAYDEADGNAHGPMWFYNTFFKEWKNGDANQYIQGMTGLSSDEKFALTASGVVGKNLTEFFERWGMTLSAEVKAKLKTYGEETRAIWYLNDQSRRDRLGGKTAATGSVTATAKLKEKTDNTISVTIDTSGITGTLQGVEIIRNGKPIAFVTDLSKTYDDVIGSGNHRTYEYDVVAYDTLGNKIGTAVDAGTVRIAYDKTINQDDYTLTRNGETVTIELKEATAISGLKLNSNNLPSDGKYQISITAEFTDDDGKVVTKDVVARSGSFGQGNQAVDDKASYLTYFQKPGATDDDTRIWTYDAKKVVITGLPDIGDSNIQLISYAGDDVAFWEEGAVGRLSAPYKYGEADGDVIEAGTLVIVGTYRGDPRFNTVKIKGLFTVTKTTEKGDVTEEQEERYLSGDTLLFAEIPADQQVSDISDGLFIFIPNVQQEAALQDKLDEAGNVLTHCGGVNLLPSQIKAVLSRTDVPDDATDQHTTAETLWIHSPGGEDLPTIVLESDGGTGGTTE